MEHNSPHRITSIILVLAAILLTLSITACGKSDSEATPLRVMTFNIEYGGAYVSFEKVVEAVRLANADIVGVQEPVGNLQRLASELGWNYDLQSYVISRHPIISPSGAEGRYVYVEVEPGKVVAIANVHLPSDPYGPDAVRDGSGPAEVLALEQATRVPPILPYLAALQPLVKSGIPVFLTGDFNSPAHTDWVEATAGKRPFLRYPMDWPVSLAVTNSGMHDSWRDVHPDPVTDPGLTWWAGRPPLEVYAFGENDARDRIDFIWYAGPASAISSELVGETGQPDVAISVSPWPSDHRAVVSGFSVSLAPLPELVSTPRRVYQRGQEVEVRYVQPGDASADIRIVSLREPLAVVAQDRVSGSGSVQFASEEFSAGPYEILLEQAGGGAVMKTDFWVLNRDVKPAIEVPGGPFNPGDAIEVAWRNGPGNRFDYIALYPAGTIADYDNGLVWSHVNASPEGTKALGSTTTEWGWPLAPGDYVARLMKDDGIEVLAESSVFRVETSPAVERTNPQ